MGKLRNIVDINKINTGDIILIEAKMQNTKGLNSVGLYARVMHKIINSNRIEVCFLSGDDSCVWFDLSDC